MPYRKRLLPLKILLPVFAIIILACERKPEIIRKTEILSLPSVTIRHGVTWFSDSGKLQLRMEAPLMTSYDKIDEPYLEFVEGIYIVFYEGKQDSVGYASARYGKYNDKKKIWELRDSVVLVNVSNDRLETEQLFWDQGKDQIYTERFVKIINDDQTIMGTGFESDIRLTRRRIRNPSGPIYLKDE